MHKELEDFFATHRAKTCEQKRCVHDQLDPIMEMCATTEAHILELETKLQKAELAAHDHALDHAMEWMQTRLRDAKLRTANLRAAGRELARAMVEIENGFKTSEQQIAGAIQAAQSTPPAPTASPTTQVL